MKNLKKILLVLVIALQYPQHALFGKSKSSVSITCTIVKAKKYILPIKLISDSKKIQEFKIKDKSLSLNPITIMYLKSKDAISSDNQFIFTLLSCDASDQTDKIVVTFFSDSDFILTTKDAQ